MTLTSADFPADGTCPEDVFSAPVPDDMQDVPLHGSTGNAAKAIKVARMPMMKFEAHLHSPPQFPAAHSESGLSVRVHTPETVQQTTMGIPLSHTVYHVESTSTLSTFPKSSCAVLRRFSDFDALYHVLRNKYTGYFIPPVPDKDLVQGKLRSDKSFLDKRTQDLEVFINECCCHKVIRASSVRSQFYIRHVCESASKRQKPFQKAPKVMWTMFACVVLVVFKEFAENRHCWSAGVTAVPDT